MMKRLKRFFSILAIFALLSGALPYAAFMTAAQAAEPEMAVSAEDPPCPMHAAPENTAEKTAPKSKMNCCGDFCTCALGNCHAAAAVLEARSSTSAIFDAASLRAAGVFALHPFLPEMATPPPKA